MEEMNATQKRAFELYVNSISIENNFTPISFKVIHEKLKSEGFESSKSSIGRWSVKWKWKRNIRIKIKDFENTKDFIILTLMKLSDSLIELQRKLVINRDTSITHKEQIVREIKLIKDSLTHLHTLY
jgi:hypothetical protein